MQEPESNISIADIANAKKITLLFPNSQKRKQTYLVPVASSEVWNSVTDANGITITTYTANVSVRFSGEHIGSRHFECISQPNLEISFIKGKKSRKETILQVIFWDGALRHVIQSIAKQVRIE